MTSCADHSLFWKGLAPVKEGGGELASDSKLAKAIERDFGSYDKFKEKLTAAALGIQGVRDLSRATDAARLDAVGRAAGPGCP